MYDLARASVKKTAFGVFDLALLPGARIIPRNYGEGPGYFSVNRKDRQLNPPSIFRNSDISSAIV